MRLWHQYLINYLPMKQLLGQHRELCALRGLGFGRKHKVVDYVFKYPYSHLYHYHLIVMSEMIKRGYFVDPLWFNIKYRGKRIGFDKSEFTNNYPFNVIIYPEHNNEYLKECLINLKNKNIFLEIKKNSFMFKVLENNKFLCLVKIIE